MAMLDDRRVLLIIGGGIAAYKGPALVRALQAEGAVVRCLMTDSAAAFVTPMSLQAVSRHRVARDLLDPVSEHEIGHIELARWPDVVLIAPATANLIARMAHGLADELATTVLLATEAPVVVAPAMNTQMLRHPATQRNIQTLGELGHTVVAPDSGELACLEVGPGRQPDPPVLIDALGARLCERSLEGQRVLVTAGATRAWLDRVRFISNPSTGRMGVAMAHAAAWLGADVLLVHGANVDVPAALKPRLTERVQVDTTRQMAEIVLARVDAHLDWAIKAAAVGDWAPTETLDEKLKKESAADDSWSLELERTPDILQEIGARRSRDSALAGLRIVGFAAETHELERHAREKLERKGCDVVLGNWVRSDAGNTFGSPDVALHAFAVGGWTASFGPGRKFDVALEVLRALSTRIDHSEHESESAP